MQDRRGCRMGGTVWPTLENTVNHSEVVHGDELGPDFPPVVANRASNSRHLKE